MIGDDDDVGNHDLVITASGSVSIDEGLAIIGCDHAVVGALDPGDTAEDDDGDATDEGVTLRDSTELDAIDTTEAVEKHTVTLTLTANCSGDSEMIRVLAVQGDVPKERDWIEVFCLDAPNLKIIKEDGDGLNDGDGPFEFEITTADGAHRQRR